MRSLALVALLAAPALAQSNALPHLLEADGDSLILRAGRGGIEMVDFVKLAQRVTGKTFTYAQRELAAAEPVRLVGAVKVGRGQFLPFFQSMMYVKGFVTRTRGEGDGEVIELLQLARIPDAGGRRAERGDEGDEIIIEAGADGIPAVDLVKLVQRASGKTFTYAVRDLADAEPVQLHGALRMRRHEVLPFLRTVLYVHGFATHTRGTGDRAVIEITPRARRTPAPAAKPPVRRWF